MSTLSSLPNGGSAYQKELRERIRVIKRKYGNKLLLAAHYYQREEIQALADIVGDSLQLSIAASQNQEAVALFFCGVHFMAETADILMNNPDELYHRRERGRNRCDVILPDFQAGCSMADMATLQEVEDCWHQLAEIMDTTRFIPVTYVNSSAEIKAFCGRHGGAACTSSNADKVLDWAFSRGERVLFLPDQHLGRNTALHRGIAQEDMVVWNHSNSTLRTELLSLEKPVGEAVIGPWGGNTPESLCHSKVILWNGFCSVHQRFTVNDIHRLRAEYPNIQVIVHPECCQAVVEAADQVGSTAFILKQIEQSPSGTIWGVGTESRMVERLVRDFSPQKTILNLSASEQYCPTMNRINLTNLCTALEYWDQGLPIQVVRVNDQIAKEAALCLQRMIDNC